MEPVRNTFGRLKDTVVVTGTTPVAIVNAGIDANSIIIFGLSTVGGTVGAIPNVKTITNGSCTIKATASDTSVYNFVVL